jgi:hypothetical protein
MCFTHHIVFEKRQTLLEKKLFAFDFQALKKKKGFFCSNVARCCFLSRFFPPEIKILYSHKLMKMIAETENRPSNVQFTLFFFPQTGCPRFRFWR